MSAQALPEAEPVEGYVWCDHDGSVHKDEPNPFDAGHWERDTPRKGMRTWVEDDCPGPHRALYVLAEES